MILRICKFVTLILIFPFLSVGQELVAKVQINATKVPNFERADAERLQNVIREFLNNNKWTNETYQPQERINCNLVINLTSWDGNSAYKAEAQIQSNRPVFGTSYQSTMLNFNDKDFDFSYTEGQPLDISDQTFLNNLSSLLAFYAYTIVGLDKDSFENLGGTSSYIKALNTVNVAQISGAKGWKGIDGLKNRYWLNQNLIDRSFIPLRTFIYEYHRNGLDNIQSSNNRGAKLILELLPALQTLDKQKLGSIFPNIYLSAKADEITNILLMADKLDRIKGYNILREVDPANLNKYQALLK